ncbi:MAG: release factor glutamine methyltransferase, partial [Rhodospirillaceae bacterium]|nr:release factor glutamine methyltransferase [Rhodospirillaceae bacterium]
PPVSPHPNPPPLAGEGVDLRRRQGLNPPPPAGEGGAPRSGDRVGACATIGSAVAETTEALAAAGLDEPRRRARRLIAAALDLSAAAVFARPERVLNHEEHTRIAAFARRVLAREPLSRVLGRREFWGLDFALSPDTLDPRPESETIVEAVLARLTDRERAYRFLDLGTGSGCLLLALLSEYPGANGIGIDIAYGAAAAARSNAEHLGMQDRACFIVGDWGGALAGAFDAVVANPPYIATAELAGLAPEVRNHDPRRALDGGADGLAAYRAITRELPRLLVPGGLFIGEIGAGQAETAAKIAAAGGLVIDDIAADLAGIPRALIARRPG